MKQSSHIASSFLGLVGSCLLAAAVHGCAEDEGNFVDPPGFAPHHTLAVALSGAHFARDTNHQLLSARVMTRRTQRAARGLDPEATLDEPSERLHLETTFHGSYADGMTVAAATHPKASLKVIPVGAQNAPSRLRSDGAVVAFEEAFPHVTSAFGGRDSKVEEFLVIPTEKDIPTLAYDLEPGTEFGHLEQDEDGRIWAYAKDGAGLFTLEPPYADDSNGKHVVGTWTLTEKQGGSYRVEAAIELKGLAFPVLLDPTFETPAWFKNANGSTFVARSSASGTFDPTHNCSVVFGGGTQDFTNFPAMDELDVRCADRRWTVATPGATKPPARYNSSLGYFGGSTNKIFLFGGSSSVSGVFGDLWQGALTCTGTTTISCSVAWTQITQPATRPSARIRAGMAWDGSQLLLFGGVAPSGVGLTDTWAYNADTNVWTLLESSTFFPDKGNFGFGYATIPTPTGREVYAAGGYFDPSISSYQSFLNSVLHWTGSEWEDVSGASHTMWSTSNGSVSTASADALPAPRYLPWMAATGNDRFLFGSGETADASYNVIMTSDAWSWSNEPSMGPVWTREPIPNNTTNYVPGARSDATAIYDENLKEMVLVAGADDAAGVFVPQGSPRAYRGQRRPFTFDQSCTDANVDGNCDDTSVLLKATFDLTTTVSSPDPAAPTCMDMEAQFYRLDSTSGLWTIVGSGFAGGGTVAGACVATRPVTASQGATSTDYSVRVRDRRFSSAPGTMTACNNAGSTDIRPTSGTAKPACLGGGATVGTATCNYTLSPSSGMTTFSCTAF